MNYHCSTFLSGMRYVGKTSIIYKIKAGEIDTVLPTAGEYTFLLSHSSNDIILLTFGYNCPSE